MPVLRVLPRQSFVVLLAAIMISASLVAASFIIASGDSHGETYYGCLFAGSVSQVGTSVPASCGRGEQIAWNAEGQPGEPGISGYEWVTQTYLDQPITSAISSHYQLACPTGKRVISGGIHTANPFGMMPIVVYSDRFNDTTWAAGLAARDEGTSGTTDVSISALCANVE